MLAIEEHQDLLTINVYGELTLADYEELEQAVLKALKTSGQISMLLDLTQMSGFTIDVAWEDIKFIGEHTHDFKRVAVVTEDQWLTWISWLNGAFTDAEIDVFDKPQAAAAWLSED